MSVYIELVILDNFIITYLLAKVTFVFLKKKVPRLRVFVGSSVGTIVAVFYPFVKSWFWLLFIKIALYLVLCTIFFAGKVDFWALSISFGALTAVFGGIIFVIALAVKGSVESALTQPFASFPLSIIIVGLTVAYFSVKKLSLVLTKPVKKAKLLRRFEICLFGKRTKLSGFVDTGNNLCDEISGLPVVVMPIKALSFISNDEILAILTDKNGRKIEMITASGKNKIILIKPDSFILYSDEQANTIVEVMVGVSLAPIAYDALLHATML